MQKLKQIGNNGLALLKRNRMSAGHMDHAILHFLNLNQLFQVRKSFNHPHGRAVHGQCASGMFTQTSFIENLWQNGIKLVHNETSVLPPDDCHKLD